MLELVPAEYWKFSSPVMSSASTPLPPISSLALVRRRSISALVNMAYSRSPEVIVKGLLVPVCRRYLYPSDATRRKGAA